MITSENRSIVRALYAQGNKKRQIARILKIDPKTVRAVLKNGEDAPLPRKDKKDVDSDLLRGVLKRTDGYIQRAHEILTEEHGLKISYSTLTRLIRKSGFLEDPGQKRHPSVGDVPGEEMQHDTTEHNVRLSDRTTRVVLSGLYMRYSKMRYLKFYPHFTRFFMKCFFHEALSFWEHAAGLCVIDNTNLAVLHGTGSQAVFNPEMVAFAKPYGFDWFAHERGHSNRKAGVERNFWSVETNFLTGRTFTDFNDLNAQAFAWATDRYATRPQSKTRLVPIDLFEAEKPHLLKLSPQHLAPPFRELGRSTDQNGYVAVDGNYFWIPGEGRPNVKIIEYEKKIRLYPENQAPLEYDLPDRTVRNRRYPEHAPRHPRNWKRSSQDEERALRSMGEAAAEYLDYIKSEDTIRYKAQFIRELYALLVTIAPTLKTHLLKRCLQYRLTGIDSIMRALTAVRSCGEAAPTEEFLKRDYQERPAYQVGCFSEENPMALPEADNPALPEEEGGLMP
jgi:transposase